jgi:hypothetical protein
MREDTKLLQARFEQLSVDHTNTHISRLEHGATGRLELEVATSSFSLGNVLKVAKFLTRVAIKRSSNTNIWFQRL